MVSDDEAPPPADQSPDEEDLRPFQHPDSHPPSPQQPDPPSWAVQDQQPPGRQRAMAHVRPISVSDIVRNLAGSDPMSSVHNFDRVYLPNGFVVRSMAEASSNETNANRSELKRKAEQISRSCSEMFSMFTSGNSSEAEARRILKTVTNVRHLPRD